MAKKVKTVEREKHRFDAAVEATIASKVVDGEFMVAKNNKAKDDTDESVGDEHPLWN